MSSAITQIQQDVFTKLQVERYFAKITVAVLREKLVEAEGQLTAVWQTVTHGKSGLGIIVGMPVVGVEDSDAPGPELLAKLPVVVLEEPNINSSPDGVGIVSEDVAIQVLKTLHQFALAQNLTIYARGDCMTPNRDYEGIRGYNLQFELRYEEGLNAKCDSLAWTVGGGNLTLTNGANTPAAAIWYTTDGSFPWPGGTGTLYAGPVNISGLAAGAIVRWAAWLANYNGSDVRSYTI